MFSTGYKNELSELHNIPPLVYLEHNDIDEQAARLTGYDQQYQQLSRGHFNGSFLTCEIDNDLALYFEYTNQALNQMAVVPNGYFAIGLLLESTGPTIFNSQEFHKGSAFIMPQNATLEATTAADMKICVVHINTELMSKFCSEQFFGTCNDRPVDLSGSIVKSDKNTSTLYALICDFLQGAEERNLCLNQKNQLVTFKNTLMTAIEWAFVQAGNSRIIHPGINTNRSQKIFHDACDLIKNKLCDDISVQYICDQLQVSRRMLEYAFYKNTYMSPGRFIKILRLNNIRREILSPENHSTPLGDLAAKWGVWHLSRFALDYRNFFDELPSSTRKSVNH